MIGPRIEVYPELWSKMLQERITFYNLLFIDQSKAREAAENDMRRLNLIYYAGG